MRSIADIGELLEREEFEAGMLKWPGPTSYTRGTARSWRTCFRAGWEPCREISYGVSASSHVLLPSLFRQYGAPRAFGHASSRRCPTIQTSNT